MVEVQLKVSRQSTEAVQRELKRLARKIGDTRRVNREVSIWLLRWVDKNFKGEGSKVGGWAPFKYGGRRVKGGINKNAKLLQDTGKMKASFKPFHSLTRAGVGSNLDRSAWHDAGVPKNNLPARRLLPNSSDREVGQAMVKIYDVHLKRATR